MPGILHSQSTLRIFAFSTIITLISLLGVGFWLGLEPLLVILILIALEITFSFENAIINARVLKTMSAMWQAIFLTLGIVIAVFGMRVIFPVLVVALSTNLGWQQVVDLALHHPTQYAEKLTEAHSTIAAFGGMFLFMLGLSFFLDNSKSIHWLERLERPLQRFGSIWLALVISLLALVSISLLPFNHHVWQTVVSGGLGIATFLVIHFLSARINVKKLAGSTKQKVGLAGLTAFLYLEILDASFSFDGVIGAFAITSDVVLIAIGLGVGAVWVRSLTVYMVRKQVLDAYVYLEHGAFYTVLVLAVILLFSIFRQVPELLAGSIGIVLLSLALVASIRQNRRLA